jgi:phosphohistidine phosphatase
MELYFLRHGKAVDTGEPDAPDDASRYLTKDGIAELEQEAEALRRIGLKPDVILTSPLVRARQTAEIVAHALHLERRLTVTDHLRPGCTIERLRELLDEHGPPPAVMLVGHEPDFSRLVGALIGPGAKIELKKAGLAVVQLDGSVRPGAATLLRLLPPKVLRLCAGESTSGAE